MLLLLWKSRVQLLKSVRKEGRKEEEQNCTLVASRRTPSTGALESFCEFFSCMQLEYCLREPLSKFEGFSTFYCNVNILYCIYGTFDPFLYFTYYRKYNKKQQWSKYRTLWHARFDRSFFRACTIHNYKLVPVTQVTCNPLKNVIIQKLGSCCLAVCLYY